MTTPKTTLADCTIAFWLSESPENLEKQPFQIPTPLIPDLLTLFDPHPSKILFVHHGLSWGYELEITTTDGQTISVKLFHPGHVRDEGKGAIVYFRAGREWASCFVDKDSFCGRQSSRRCGRVAELLVQHARARDRLSCQRMPCDCFSSSASSRRYRRWCSFAVQVAFSLIHLSEFQLDLLVIRSGLDHDLQQLTSEIISLTAEVQVHDLV